VRNVLINPGTEVRFYMGLCVKAMANFSVLFLPDVPGFSAFTDFKTVLS
jgi:hypothetical protein